MKTSIYLLLISAISLSFSNNQTQTKNLPVFSNELTPNGDGKNDVFAIGHLEEYPDNKLMIFNRWGSVVYESSPYQGNWTGNCIYCKKKSDVDLQDGVYYYQFTDNQTGTKYDGYLNLMR